VAARRSDSDSEITSAVVQLGIGPKYFETLGVPMAAGREFNVQDAPSSVILNQTAALDLFGSPDVVGRSLRDASGQRLEVIGVARDSRSAYFNAKPAPTLYTRLPLSPTGASVIVRGAPGPQTLAAIREDLARLDPNLVLLNPRTMDKQLAQMKTLLSGASAFYGGLGIFGLILASVGLAGVSACAVVRRRKELGIRMALGARRSQVVRLVMREGAALVLAGGVLGLLGEVAASRILSATFSEIARLTDSARSNIALAAGAPLLLIAITMSACYIPARRSARIDPSKVLREE
jgi:ABC-type antimicrobial peptide transport system permease subunit